MVFCFSRCLSLWYFVMASLPNKYTHPTQNQGVGVWVVGTGDAGHEHQGAEIMESILGSAFHKQPPPNNLIWGRRDGVALFIIFGISFISKNMEDYTSPSF